MSFTLLGITFTQFGVGCAAALAVYLLALRLLTRKSAEAAAVRLAALLSVPLCWLCARLVFVAVDLIGYPFDGSIYLNGYGSLGLALRFWEGGYSLMGGLWGLLLALWIAERALQTAPFALQDAAAVALPLALALVRVAEYGTGFGLGREVHAQWLIDTGLCIARDGAMYWPVCLLEALEALALFGVMLVKRIRRAHPLPGDMLRTLLLLFGLTQALLESLHGDGHMVVHFVRAQQVFALVMALCCMVAWSRRMHGDAGMEAICWGVTLACVALAVWAEFGVDRWGNRALAYGLMAVCLAGIGWVAGRLRAWSGIEAQQR